MMNVTLKQIAHKAGVSTCTVSRVLNGKQKEAYKPALKRAEHIRRVAAEMGFVPSASARAMQRNSTQLIGLLVPEAPPTSLVDYETILGINSGLEAEGYVLALTRSSELCQIGADIQPETNGTTREKGTRRAFTQHPSRIFQERMVDGMIVLGLISPHMTELVRRTARACLWLDTNIADANNCLRRDEHHAGRLAAEKVIARGYRDLIFVNAGYGDTQPHYSNVDRIRGAREAAAKAGLTIREGVITLRNPGQIEAPITETIKRGCAVIASSDRTATVILTRMAQTTKRIGRDFALVSCDRTEVTRRHWPGLSCVDVDRGRFGKLAADMMLGILHDPRHQHPSQTLRWNWHEGDTSPPLRHP